MRRCGRTGSAIFAGKLANRTQLIGPFGSALITGFVFGLGFDTATQISAITLSAIASATLGLFVALVLAGIFCHGNDSNRHVKQYNSLLLFQAYFLICIYRHSILT